MTERDIARWTREVAEDPGAPSFVRLARAYRAQGRRAAARDVVLQGLEQNPEHVGGHGLLALIYVEDGRREKAGDEWQTMLSLDPGNFEASRGLGFLALEQGDLGDARRHLETAASTRPDDPAVKQALEVLARREEGAESAGVEGAEDAEVEGAEKAEAAEARRDSTSIDEIEIPAARRRRAAELAAAREAAMEEAAAAGEAAEEEEAAPEAAAVRAGPEAAAATAGEAATVPAALRADGSAPDGGWNPARLFDVLSDEGPFLGAVVLDGQGLVLAGEIELEGARGDLLAALINSAVGEARRATEVLGLSMWEGMLLDCDRATLHVAGVNDAVVLMAVTSDAPPGWAVRTAGRAQALARDFLEARA